MAKKMLIDATHAEETRVVVVDGNKVEEFDFESENKRQIAGNIYLAKVTRVEPSLQAAFVDYGGNRHGFLAFSEIHPDYYQIPVADREALLAEEKALAEAQEAEDEERRARPSRSRRSRSRGRSKARAEEAVPEDAVTRSEEIPGMAVVELDEAEEDLPREVEEGTSSACLVPETPVETPAAGEEEAETEAETGKGGEEGAGPVAEAAEEPESEAAEEPESEVDEAAEAAPGDDGDAEAEIIESVAEDDLEEEIRPPRKVRPRKYKIQEVIKVRQIMLVQVVKEERGNKGAALTTYLSLAGRYCVLMPNTARGGGISRKITNAADRKKLKEIASEIEVPEGAGLIIRTAGAQRTRSEIKRDYEYLQRLWEQIRELTLKSIAPAKIYEEGDLIKRSIRDLYNKDIDEVIVEGEAGYRVAKDFMKMIMPSHAKNVKLYTDPLPLFARYQVESYLSSMFNPTVQLKSGGYIVIDVTEALVAIDVNSGRSTKEGSIEETALKTNLEAAEEIARQLRLRDLAGLIVIDFIDMEERRNNLAVEKRLKEKLKTDRARIQVGRISGFGLLEMSRQRLRPGMLEASTQPCPHCHGTGLIRSEDSLALSILRQLEEEGVRRRTREVLLKAPVAIANYLINQKREHIAQIEARYGMSVRIEADPFLIAPDFSIEKFKTASRPVAEAPVVSVDASLMADMDEGAPADAPEEPEAREESPAPKKRRRRRRRRKSGGQGGEAPEAAVAQAPAESQAGAEEAKAVAEAAGEAAPEVASEVASEAAPEAAPAPEGAAPQGEAEAVSEEAPKEEAEQEAQKPAGKKAPRKRASRAKTARAEKTAEEGEAPADEVPAAVEPAEEPAPAPEAVEAEQDEARPARKPRRTVTRKSTRSRKAKAGEEAAPAEESTEEAAPSGAEAAGADAPEAAEPAEAVAEEAPKPKKRATRSRSRTSKAAKEKAEEAPAPEAEAATPEPEPESAPETAPEPAPAAGDESATPAPEAQAPEAAEAESERPRRRGWWSVGR